MSTVPEPEAPPLTITSSAENAATPPIESQKAWLDQLLGFGKLRDGILPIFATAAALDFALGYISVVLAAGRNNLGFISPIQAQCLLAGLCPTILVGIVLLLALGTLTVVDRTANWIRPAPHPASVERRKPFIWCVGVGFVLLMAWRFLFQSQNLSLMLFQLLMYWLWFYIFGAVIISYPQESHWRADKYMLQLCSRVLPILVPLGLLWACGNVWVQYSYPHLSQEFGGMKPRYAFVDLKKDTLSPETVNLLLPDKMVGTTNAVSRSRQLAVYYENDGTLFVRRAEADTRAPVQEVKKDAIAGITWVGYEPQRQTLAAPKK